MSKCSDCREFYEACKSIGRSLSAEAKLTNHEYPSLSNDDIMQSITESRTNDGLHRARYRPYGIAAAIAAALALGLIFFPTSRQTNDDKEFEDAIAALTGMINPQAGDALSRIIEEPMEIEFQNIIGDTKSAANFLLTCVDFDIDGHGRIVRLNKADNKDPAE